MVTIDQVNVAFARYFGILLVNTIAQIEETTIDFTKAGPLPPNPTPVFGDAISMWSTNASWAQRGPKPSFVLLKNNSTNFTDRVAFSVFGGGASLKCNTFSFQGIDIQVETWDRYVADLTDLEREPNASRRSRPTIGVSLRPQARHLRRRLWEDSSSGTVR